MALAASASRAKLAEIFDAEISELAQFVASQSERDALVVENHFRWFLLQNPARESRFPLGYGLRSPQGQLVGCILCVPQAFRCQDQVRLVMGSSCFYVHPDYRGSGGVLFLKFSELAKRWPLFANSANADAARLWKARGAVPIPDSDHELFGVLRWHGIIEEGLRRLRAPGTIAKPLSHPAAALVRGVRRWRLSGGAGALVALSSAEEVLDLSIQDSTSEPTADRNPRYIHWRYFAGPDSTATVFAYRDQRVESDVLVTVNRRPRGYRSQIRTVNVLDIYPKVSPDVCVAIVGSLAERYRGEVDAIVLRGFDPSRQESFKGHGFLFRRFEAPNGWLLDRSGFLRGKDWYTVPADGDWLI